LVLDPVGSASATWQYQRPRASPLVARAKVSDRSVSSAQTLMFGVTRGRTSSRSPRVFGTRTMNSHVFRAGKLPSVTA